MKPDPSAPPLYPDLPKDDRHNYRLNMLMELQQKLITERDNRMSFYKKYKRGINVIDGIDTTLITAGLGMGATGGILSTTIVAVPVVIPLEIVAAVCGVFGIALKFVNRKLYLKAKKHDEIRILAEAKMNSIKDIVSKSLQDGEISEQEFSLVLNDFDKYNELKKGIRAKTVKISDAEKQKLIQQGKAEVFDMIKKNS